MKSEFDQPVSTLLFHTIDGTKELIDAEMHDNLCYWNQSVFGVRQAAKFTTN